MQDRIIETEEQERRRDNNRNQNTKKYKRHTCRKPTGG